VVTLHGDGLFLAQSIDHAIGVRTVAHDVAEHPQSIKRFHDSEHGVEGRGVGVDIREDGDAHRPGA
jgi:hypothetical protein